MSDRNAETFSGLQQWHKGERGGLDALLDRHLPWIQERVHKRLGSKLRRLMETGDIVQDAAVQFLQHGPRFLVSDDDHFRALLTRIIENILRDKHDWFTAQRRDIARTKPLPSETVLHLDPGREPVRTPSQSVERHEREAWLRLGMEFVDAEDREILILRHWKNLDNNEIGKKLGITPNAARMRLERATGRLAKKVGALRRGKVPEIPF